MEVVGRKVRIDLERDQVLSYLNLVKQLEARVEILRLKQKYFDGTKYKNGLTGKDIYEKVLPKS